MKKIIILDYLQIEEKEFYEIINKFRPKHIWKKENNKWILRSAVWMNDREVK